jgi:hypothetical protein
LLINKYMLILLSPPVFVNDILLLIAFVEQGKITADQNSQRNPQVVVFYPFLRILASNLK